MPVAVPNLIGLGNPQVKVKLASLLLRHAPKLPFSATGDGSATAQSPAAGTMVSTYSIVTVTYPSPLGPLPDPAIEGPTLPAGTYEGQIKSVTAGDPFGSGPGAWIDFSTVVDGSPITFTGVLYRDPSAVVGPPPPRTEWMRRGAMLGIAQRAFTHNHTVRLVTTVDVYIQSIEIIKP